MKALMVVSSDLSQGLALLIVKAYNEQIYAYPLKNYFDWDREKNNSQNTKINFALFQKLSHKS